MVELRRLGQHGRSLYCTVPRSIADALFLKRGDRVALFIDNGRMVLRKFTDADFVAAIDKPLDELGEEPAT